MFEKAHPRREKKAVANRGRRKGGKTGEAKGTADACRGEFDGWSRSRRAASCAAANANLAVSQHQT